MLDRITSAGIVSERGRAAIIQAVDPMHDMPIGPLAGWPDMETAPSVVQCIKQTIPITTTFTDGSNWDCHIAVLPFANLTNFTPVLSRVNQIINNYNHLSDVYNINNVLGLINVWQTHVNADVTIDQIPIAELGIDPAVIHGPCRIVGVGYEVSNTTAEIYKQGQCVGYRLPQPSNKPSEFKVVAFDEWGSGDSAATHSFTGQMLRPPVANTATAMLIAGTRQWLAKEGIYQVVPIIAGPDNPPLAGDYTQPIFPVVQIGEDEPDGNRTGPSGAGPINQASVVIPTQFGVDIPNETGVTPLTCAPCCRIMPLQQCGSIFTGLSAQTSLQLTLNVFVESFPGPAESTILTLATPSTPYDTVALECISRAFLDLPVCFKFNENGLGDAFAETLANMADVIAPIAVAVGHPEIAALITGGGTIARGVQRYLTAPSGKDVDYSDLKENARKARVAERPKKPPQKHKPAVSKLTADEEVMMRFIKADKRREKRRRNRAKKSGK